MSLFNSKVAKSLGASCEVNGISALKSSCDAKYSRVSDSELAQWISVASSLKESDLSGIESFVSTRTFLCGQFGLADAALSIALATCAFTDKVKTFPAIMRYVTHIQTMLQAQEDIGHLSFTAAPTPIPYGCGISAPSAASSSADKGGAAKAEKNSDTKKDKGQDNGKAGNKAKETAPAPAPAPAGDAELEPHLLEIKVGVIKKCWNHPDSEKLLCEEVDVGEAAPRNIASGIRAFYSAEEFVGKRVMVLANLKGRSIAGFKSEGMVLCACNEDHSKVAILEPPADAKAGDKVEYAGFEGKEAATPSAVAKKKIFEKLAVGLRTDAEGVAFSGKHKFLVGGKPCTSSMKGAVIS